MKTDDYCIIIASLKNTEQANCIADFLINENLATCIQISDQKSYYKWKEPIEYLECQKIILNIKTKNKDYTIIRNKIENYSCGVIDNFVHLPKNQIFIPFIHII